MRRLIAVLVTLVVFATACGGDGPVEGVLGAVGLSENVDVEAPPEPVTVDDLLAQMAADGFNGIVMIDRPAGLRVAPMGTVDGPGSQPVDEDTVDGRGGTRVRLRLSTASSSDDRPSQ